MTTEDLIDSFIDAGMKAFKKLYRCTPEGHKLDRHEPALIQGYEFTCWREYTVFKMGEYIHGELPGTHVDVELDGNDSILTIDADDDMLQKLNTLLYTFLKKNNLL